MYNGILYVCVWLITQSCPTLWEPMDSTLPGFCVHGILQEKILEWVAISFPWNLPYPGMEAESLAYQADYLSFEPPGKPHNGILLS